MNLVSREEAAKAFNCSVSTFDRKYRTAYGFPVVRMETGWDKFDADQFEKFRERHQL